jgi:hypothetical protein
MTREEYIKLMHADVTGNEIENASPQTKAQYREWFAKFRAVADKFEAMLDEVDIS